MIPGAVLLIGATAAWLWIKDRGKDRVSAWSVAAAAFVVLVLVVLLAVVWILYRREKRRSGGLRSLTARIEQLDQIFAQHSPNDAADCEVAEEFIKLFLDTRSVLQDDELSVPLTLTPTPSWRASRDVGLSLRVRATPPSARDWENCARGRRLTKTPKGIQLRRRDRRSDYPFDELPTAPRVARPTHRRAVASRQTRH